MNLTELKQMPAPELLSLSQKMGVEGIARSRKQDIIFSILKAHAKKGGGLAKCQTAANCHLWRAEMSKVD